MLGPPSPVRMSSWIDPISPSIETISSCPWPVVAALAGDGVQTAFAPHLVVAGSSLDVVIAATATDEVVPSAAVDQVPSLQPDDHVVSGCAPQLNWFPGVSVGSDDRGGLFETCRNSRCRSRRADERTGHDGHSDGEPQSL